MGESMCESMLGVCVGGCGCMYIRGIMYVGRLEERSFGCWFVWCVVCIEREYSCGLWDVGCGMLME